MSATMPKALSGVSAPRDYAKVIGKAVDAYQLQLPTPFSALVISACVFGFFHITSPFIYAETYKPSSWLLLAINFIAIWGPVIAISIRDSRLCEVLKTDEKRLPEDPTFLYIGACLLLVVSLFGGVLKAYDLFIAKGFSLNSNVNELYQQNSEVSASIAGLLASLMYPLAYPTLIVILTIRRCTTKAGWFWWTMTLFSMMAFAVAPLNSILMGKRGAVFSVAILVSLAYFYSGLRVRLRTILYTLVGGLALFIFSSAMLRHRLELKGASTQGAVEVGRFTDLLEISKNFRAISRYGDLPEFAQVTMYDWAALQAYVVHAVPEYLHAVEQFNDAEHQYGKYTFSLAAKFFSYFTSVHYDAVETSQVPPRTLIYSTLFGPFYFDFGLASPIASLILGLAFVLMYRLSRTSPFAVPLYLYLYTVMLLSPMISFIELFFGFYYFAACVSGGIALKIFSLFKVHGLSFSSAR